MTPVETARASAEAVAGLASHFMLDPATYGTGAELGFEGMTFYVGGRGGVLGDVPGEVVAASFVFFAPELVVAGWDACADVMSRRKAAEAFAGCGHRWAREHLSDEVDLERLADLAGRIVDAASVAGAPLFAGWRQLDVPDDPPARVLHHLNALREHRMAMHAAAVLAAGISPLEAVTVRTAAMAGLFGWTEPLPDPEPVRARWEQAEAATDLAVAPVFEVLDDAERSEFVDLAVAVTATMS